MNKGTRVIGIDPGMGGAIAVLQDGQLVAVFDMPTMERARKSATSKQEVNGAALAEIIRSHSVGRAYLERVNAMPSVGKGPDGKPIKRGMGAASAFNFGEGFGIVKGVLAAFAIPVELVHSQTWKKRAGLIGAGKDASRTQAQMLFPHAELSLKKHVGRAEAILIAYYGSQA